MSEPQIRRERIALQQLGAVTQTRRLHLQAQRAALAQRERTLALALEGQALDEALLQQQRQHWAAAWQAWAGQGGMARQAAALHQDKALLKDMAALVAQRRAALQAQAERLAAELRAWTQRWLGAQALDDSLGTRASQLQVTVERAQERQRDEEALVTRAHGRSSLSQPWGLE